MTKEKLFIFIISLCSASLFSQVNATLTDKQLHTVSPYLLGQNLSYFNDLDTIWSKYNVVEKLETFGAKALRYPGGEETSRFHWEHPGVNGYVDYWNEKTWKYRWQSTYVAPEDWGENQAFMDLDEYLSHCKKMKIPPLVGVNISSGLKANDLERSIAEAQRMAKHIKSKGIKELGFYLDNEPWHHGTYVNIPIEQYALETVRFSKILKEILPKSKIYVNAFGDGHLHQRSKLNAYLSVAGEAIDYIDAHWYWAWNISSWKLWKSQQSMHFCSEWRKPKDQRSYLNEIRHIKSIINENPKYAHIGLCVLEWNVAPQDVKKDIPFTENQNALVQSEMMMQFIQGDIYMACMWPLSWDVYGKKTDGFRSIIDHSNQCKGNTSYHLLSKYKHFLGNRLIEIKTNNEAVHIIAAQGKSKELHFMVLNKSSEKKLHLNIQSNYKKVKALYSVNEHKIDQNTKKINIEGSELTVDMSPYSMTFFTLKK